MTDCAHCVRPQRGYAAVNSHPLCHPDEGLDCYRLVTIYGHEMPCRTCQNRLNSDPKWESQWQSIIHCRPDRTLE